jgi:succinoglycan biosynthesis protein ExoM
VTKVTVGIPTIGRRSLRKTLASLDRKRLPAGLEIEILVVDDSVDLQVVNLISDLHVKGLKILTSGQQNIAEARNICLEEAKGDFILFIDDDEVAPPDWIGAMVAQIENSGADCLFAPVKPLYQEDAPEWLKKIEPLFPCELKTAMKRSRIIGRTGNSIIRRSFIDRNQLRFDPHYRTAGEDLHFYFQCLRAGAKAIAVNSPELEESVCSEYHHLRPVLSKLYRRGQAYADVRCRLSSKVALDLMTMSALALLKLATTLVALPFALLLGRMTLTRLAFRAAMEAGKMHGLGAFTLRAKTN